MIEYRMDRARVVSRSQTLSGGRGSGYARLGLGQTRVKARQGKDRPVASDDGLHSTMLAWHVVFQILHNIHSSIPFQFMIHSTPVC